MLRRCVSRLNDFEWFQKLELNEYVCFCILSYSILGARIRSPHYYSESVSSPRLFLWIMIVVLMNYLEFFFKTMKAT
jgi:hypothetical protein